jgi:hypothetical protein
MADTPEELVCDLCYFATLYKDSLRYLIKIIHLGMKKKEQPVKTEHHNCNICDYATHQKALLEKHIKAIHEEITDKKCPQCDYKTIYDCSLTAYQGNSSENQKQSVS